MTCTVFYFRLFQCTEGCFILVSFFKGTLCYTFIWDNLRPTQGCVDQKTGGQSREAARCRRSPPPRTGTPNQENQKADLTVLS